MSVRNHLHIMSRFALVGALAAGVAACSDDEGDNNGGADAGGDTGGDTGGDAGMGGEVIEITEDITADTTWTTGNTYVLNQLTFVAGGSTLTIQEGTTVVGVEGAALVISRAGRIDAQGTEENPIVFTSAKPAGSRQPGDWGGLVMLGDGKDRLALMVVPQDLRRCVCSGSRSGAFLVLFHSLSKASARCFCSLAETRSVVSTASSSR